MLLGNFGHVSLNPKRCDVSHHASNIKRPAMDATLKKICFELK